MKELIEKYKAAQIEVNKLQSQLYKTSDGFMYIAELFCYGSRSVHYFINEYTAQLFCDEYYFGDNGIVDLYTDNPNHDIRNYGKTIVLTSEELEKQFPKIVNTIHTKLL